MSVKIGVVGLGWISRSYVLPVLSKFSDVVIAAICDIDENKCQELAAQYKISQHYTDYREMLDKSKLDGVMVTVIPPRTAEISLACLAKGLACYIEKPPGITVQETEQLLKAAQENKVKAMVAFNRRFMPVVGKIKEIIQDRGELIQVSFEFYKGIGEEPVYSGVRIDPLVGTIIHGVDLLRYVAGEVETVKSDIHQFQSTLPNSFNALLRFRNGAVGTMNTNWTVGGRLERYGFHGPGYSIYMDSPKLAVLVAGQESVKIKPGKSPLGGIKATELPGYVEGFPQEISHFIECVKSGSSSLCPISEGLRTMQLVDTIKRSMAFK